MNKKKLDAFLKDYEEIIRKHNMIVFACGCCNSPFLVTPDEIHPIEEHLEHLRENI